MSDNSISQIPHTVSCSVEGKVIKIRQEIFNQTINKSLDTENKLVQAALVSLGWRKCKENDMMDKINEIEQERAEFEEHFSKPPFEWEFHRYGEDSAWPGNYQNYDIQCAWEGWRARSMFNQDEYLAMVAVMQIVDPAILPGLTVEQRCALGRFAKPVSNPTVRQRMSSCKEPMIPVRESAVNWLKKHYQDLCVKAGLCEKIAGRYYTLTTSCECQRRTAAVKESENNL